MTEADICSLECKNKNLLKLNSEPQPIEADNYNSFIKPQILNNVDFDASKANLKILPAILYQQDLILIAPKNTKRHLCIIIPLIQRLIITGCVFLYSDIINFV